MGAKLNNSKNWNLMSSRRKQLYLAPVVEKFKTGERFLAKQVATELKNTYPGLQFYRGLVMSVGYRLKGFGFQMMDQTDKGMHYWFWPPAEDQPAPLPETSRPPVLEAEPMTPETIREAVRAKEQQMKASGLAERCEAFTNYLKSEHSKHLILSEAGSENEFTDISLGRARQAKEALIIFKHMFGIKET